MEKRSYDQLLSSLGGTEALSMLKLGVAFYKVSQTGSPQGVKLDKSAKDPILKARTEIGRTMKPVYFNPSYIEQSGFREEELLEIPDIVPFTEQSYLMTQEMIEALWENIRKDSPWHGLISWKRPDQKPSVVEFDMIPLSFNDGYYALGFHRDITAHIVERNQLQAKIKKMASYFAKAAHDLRSSIVLMRHGVSYLDKFPQDQHVVIDTFDHHSNYMDILSSNLLDYNALVTGQITLQPNWAVLSQLGDTIQSLVLESTRQKGLQWAMEFPPGFVEVWVDSVQLLRMLRNLVDNAVKYTETGWVKLSCKLLGGPAPAKGIEFHISDTGMGIAAQDQEKVFQPCTSLTRSTTGDKGSGLGLSIVEEVVKLLGGTISLKSALSEGTDITICLPQMGYIDHHE